jgi:hypothetical protein
MTPTITIQEFLKNKPLKLDCVSVLDNPNMPDNGYDKGTRFTSRYGGDTVWLKRQHYQCALTNTATGKKMMFFYTKGSAHHDKRTGRPIPPKMEEVLETLSLDNPRGENFSDWCANTDYDTDSVRAKQTYDLCCEQSAKLATVLGDDYATLINQVDFDAVPAPVTAPVVNDDIGEYDTDAH